MAIKDIIEKLYLYDFAPVSPASDDAIETFCSELQFQVHETPSGTEKNGWLVPQSWCYTKAKIQKDGKDVYDGRTHPLGVVGYSPSFKGRVDLSILKEHLFYSLDWEEDIVFHCTHFFRPSERTWGFCVPKNIYDSLEEGFYDVEIESRESQGTMKILEYSIPGETSDTIVFHAHNCHPGQANDDLSGCAVGIEFFKRLALMKKRKYTYTLLISPELFGSFYWLDRLNDEQRMKLKYAVMLKSLGNNSPLKLQRSYFGNTELDLSARNSIKHIDRNYTEGAFRRVYGNDETIFEAPGYEIPTISLTRFPFPEYHTSRDTPAIILESKLEEVVTVLVNMIFALEHNFAMKAKFKGLLALSHPRYNLYQPFWNPADKSNPRPGQSMDWHYLMIDMFRDFNERTRLLEISERHNLPFQDVFAYLSKLRDSDAIEFIENKHNEEK